MDIDTEIADLQAVINLMSADQRQAQATADAATAQVGTLQATAVSQSALAQALGSYVDTIQGVVDALTASQGSKPG